MKYIYLVLLGVLVVASCKQKEAVPKEWVFVKTIQLEGVYPIGIVALDGKLWLSDGDNNRLVQIDANGKIEQKVDSLERPMHIDADGESLYIPQYGEDNIATLKNGVLGVLALKDSLDAPAGVSVFKNEKAIADFYNNRILYSDGDEWISFGKEGKKQGEFYYPTDVQITDSLIWVADAYNNRIQAFDKKGGFVKMMGQDQKMNAATGIFVSEQEVFVTDFENDRVLIFDHEGKLLQEISQNIEKATDLMLFNSQLYVINYRNGKINVFNFDEVPRSEVE
ncbi:NHL repeat-containing protein [Maribacter chungangensis]|uniref:NHL repeat-containing protein n=1 Tax=Maribacter chungangensis TaxID=1069117 RepID=A0ABW3B7B1_9FLAO